MDNSFHSDNSICPINIISQVLSFLASFRSRQIQCPFPLKGVSEFLFRSSLRSSNRKSQGKPRFRESKVAVGR